MKILLRLAVVVVVLALAAGLLLYGHYQRFLDAPLNVPEDGVAFEIASGSSLFAVSDELASRGIVAQPTYLRWHAQLSGKAGSVQAGDYLITAGSTPRSLLRQFTTGQVRLYPFTIIEGWNRWELADALRRDPNIVDVPEGDDWAELLQELGADSDYPEGLFLPETYLVPAGTRAKALLANAFEDMQDVLAEEWMRRSDASIVESPYEALILASIIEKETARGDERQRISGVFTRRIQSNMRLQTDPTVIYGLLPDFNGDLTRRDLRSDTAYNTYTRAGLPPTPIAMPGREAIHAALNPADGSSLYFVATGLSDGSHTFSDTLEEHEAAVQVYLERLRRGDGT